MSADLLRRAAALMRERAQAATPGPWHGNTPGARSYGGLVSNAPPTVADLLSGRYAHEQEGYGGTLIAESIKRQNAEHIASWHPAVAVAVADLLVNEANAMEPAAPELVPPYNEARRSLLTAVAHAYLGEPG